MLVQTSFFACERATFIYAVLSLKLTWKLIPETGFTNIEVGFRGFAWGKWSRP